MNGIPHISSPYSESWVYWIILLLSVLIFFNHSVRNSVAIAFRSIYSHSDRIYSNQNSNLLVKFCSWIFRIIIFALAIYVAIFETGDFSFLTYLAIVGIVSVVCLLQHALILCVGWVFVTRKQLDNGLGQLENVRNSIGVMLLPILVIMVWINNPLCSWILLGVLGTIFVLLTLTKSLQLFCKNILSVLYILLYLICLEIIPMGGILLWTQHILQ